MVSWVRSQPGDTPEEPALSLYRREGSKFLWSKLYAGGLVHRFSTGATTKVAALRKEREEAGRLDRLYKAAADKSITTLSAQFLENAEAGNRAPETRAKMEEHITKQIIPFFGAHRDASTITIKDLEDYKAKRVREVQPQTVCKELSTLRQMIRFGGETLKLFPPGEIPTTRNPKLPKYSPSWRLLNDDELARLVAELAKLTRRGKEALPYFLLMANTGMRSGEEAAVRWDWVDMEKREINLPASATKTRTARTVPLNDSALAALLMLRKEGAIGKVFQFRTHYTAWHKAVHMAGLARLNAGDPGKTSGVRPHDLRHSYGSLLHAAGVPTPEVRDILGHVTLMMANLYAHTFNERLHTAVNSVNVGAVPRTVPLKGSTVPENVMKRQEVSRPKRTASATVK